jgi:hypothetical protein
MKPGVYRHYKGGVYYLITTALAVETGKVVVVYSALYPVVEGPEKTFTRNLNGPDGFITPAVLDDGTVVPRFEYIGDILPPDLHPPPAASRV